MGYRSDVVALIYPMGGEDNLLNYEKLKTLMNTTFKEVYDYWQDPHFTWDDTHRVLKFSIESVKWYDSYPEVAEFEQFLVMIDGLDYEYEFMRVGENYEDVETRCTDNAEYYLGLRREIEVSF